jgi:hypothetical protein
LSSSSSLHPNMHNVMPKRRNVFAFFIIVLLLQVFYFNQQR